jgi:tetratricopeptide (TPR) repeat protein
MALSTRRLASLTLGLCLWTLPALAGPRRTASPGAAQQVDQAIQLYHEGRYRQAEQLLLRALEAPELDESRKLGALQFLAFSQVAQGDLDAAGMTFERLLGLRPDFVLPAGTPPKIVTLFEKVRAAQPPPPRPEPPGLAHDPPAGGGAPRPLTLVAEVNRMPVGGQVSVAYRTNPRSPFSRMSLEDRGEGRYAVDLPAPVSPEDRQVEYFLELLGAEGQVLAGAGEDDEPLRVAFAPAPPPLETPAKDGDEGGVSVHWWLWPVVGAVLLGAGLAIGLTVGGGGEPTGSIRVRIDGSTP